jgi:hypothetical protein
MNVNYTGASGAKYRMRREKNEYSKLQKCKRLWKNKELMSCGLPGMGTGNIFLSPMYMP